MATNKRAGPIPPKRFTKAFREDLADVARVQLFTWRISEQDLRELLRLIVAKRLGCVETLFELRPNFEQFITDNLARIEPVVSKAIQRATEIEAKARK